MEMSLSSVLSISDSSIFLTDLLSFVLAFYKYSTLLSILAEFGFCIICDIYSFAK